MSQPKNNLKTNDVKATIAVIKNYLNATSALEFNGMYNNNLKKLHNKSLAMDEDFIVDVCDDYHELFETLDHLQTFIVGMELDQKMTLEIISESIYCLLDCISKINKTTYKNIIKNLASK